MNQKQVKRERARARLSERAARRRAAAIVAADCVPVPRSLFLQSIQFHRNLREICVKNGLAKYAKFLDLHVLRLAACAGMPMASNLTTEGTESTEEEEEERQVQHG